jgi:protein-tyrosine phosphatase
MKQPRFPGGDHFFPLNGASNFRDAGGCQAAGGRRMRLGQLFRSDALNKLSASDLAALSRLDIRQVIDLRSQPEQEHDPDRLPPQATYHFLPITLVWQAPFVLQKKLLSGDVRPGEFAADLVRGYSEIPVAYAGVFAQTFRLLLRPEGLPALIHCTGGKDRTGMAVALVQTALGVPRQSVFEGYLASNLRRELVIQRWTTLVWLASRLRTPPSHFRPLLETRGLYLQAFFESIERQYGSVDAYLRQGLGLQPFELELLKEKLLEDALDVI